jgi:predicted acyl esterase
VLLAWFDRWVKDLPAPIPPEPTFVSYEGPKGAAGTGWRELAWNASGAGTTYRLGAGGTLTPTATPGAPVTVHEPAEPGAPGGSATFTSGPLGGDHVLVGHSSLTLQATLTAGDANLYVELIDVDPRGGETVVNDGFLAASHRSGHVEPDPVTPGAPTGFQVAVRADHYRFTAGHRLRVRVSGGSARSLVPVPAPVDITIQTGSASTLHLPEGWES